MIRKSLFVCFCCGLVLASACGEDDAVRPEDEKWLTLEGEPVDTVYITSLDSVGEHYSDSFTVDWDSLGYEDTHRRAYYGWMCDEDAAANELVTGDDGTITVTIADCPTDHTWRLFYSDRNDLDLAEKDSVNTADSSYDATYTFEIHEPGKGYIGFLEESPSDYGPREKSLGVMYTCGPIDTLRVEADSIAWFYKITALSSDVSVTLKGRTNAHKLFIETYGDGEIGTLEISLDDDGAFAETFGVAFIYKGVFFLGTSSKLYVIGTVGPPKIIDLENPLRASGLSRTP